MNGAEIKKTAAKITVLVNLRVDLDNLKRRLPMAIGELKKAIQSNKNDKEKLKHYVAIFEPTKKFEAAVVTAVKAINEMIEDVSEKKLKQAKTSAELKEKLRKKLATIKLASDSGAKFFAASGEPHRWGPPESTSVLASLNYNKDMINNIAKLQVGINSL